MVMRPMVTYQANCDTVGCLVYDTVVGFSQSECAGFLKDKGWHVTTPLDNGWALTWCNKHKPAHAVQDVRS